MISPASLARIILGCGEGVHFIKEDEERLAKWKEVLEKAIGTNMEIVSFPDRFPVKVFLPKSDCKLGSNLWKGHAAGKYLRQLIVILTEAGLITGLGKGVQPAWYPAHLTWGSRTECYGGGNEEKKSIMLC